jgi:hypothetical protein
MHPNIGIPESILSLALNVTSYTYSHLQRTTPNFLTLNLFPGKYKEWHTRDKSQELNS